MKPWRVGDKIGAGVVYLPDTMTKKAYTAACQSAQIESAAKYIIGLGSIEARRGYINKFPKDRREELQNKVKELWEKSR